jgi:hypothetical protein
MSQHLRRSSHFTVSPDSPAAVGVSKSDFLPCQVQTQEQEQVQAYESVVAFDGVLETPPLQLIDKRSARESLVSAAPFFSPPASHTPQSSLSAQLALFCRSSPPPCECAILAPRTRPFHLTGFTTRLGPKAARLRTGEFAAAPPPSS